MKVNYFCLHKFCATQTDRQTDRQTLFLGTSQDLPLTCMPIKLVNEDSNITITQQKPKSMMRFGNNQSTIPRTADNTLTTMLLLLLMHCIMHILGKYSRPHQI